MLIPFGLITSKYLLLIYGIVHIGSHECEELAEYHEYGLTNREILWVEANPSLVDKIHKKDLTIRIENYICTNTDEGIGQFNIANDTSSSSIFNFRTHTFHYPNIKYDKTVEIPNIRLDTLYKKYLIDPDFANFANINAQGSELLVLEGMGQLIKQFHYIYIKLHKEAIYDGCPLVADIDAFLSKYEFQRVETEWTNKGWGAGLYIRH